MHTKCTQKKQDKPSAITELSIEEIETLKNEELTDKQRLFFVCITQRHSMRQEHIKKHIKSSYTTALTNGSAHSEMLE